MDPVSQGALGASFATALARNHEVRTAALLGCLGGLMPDVDVLIQDPSDPLLFLEYHRQFTHSLIFIPVGALFCAVLGWPFVRRVLRFRDVWWYCLLGYATHGLLDSCTTYGTQLLWPFSSARIAWNNISIIDPLYTIPIVLLVIFAVQQKTQRFARIAFAWSFIYLAIGVVQRERAETAGHEIATGRGHDPVRLEAKPGFAQLLLWKIVYEADGQFYVDAVRVGTDTTVFGGDTITKVSGAADLSDIAPPGSVQAADIERFRWFSNDYLARHPADPERLIDIRYSMLPNEIKPLWGIQLAPDTPDQHVQYVTNRDASGNEARRLWQMLTYQGASPATIQE